MSFYHTVSAWHIPAAAWAASLTELAADGRRGTEGIALWLGTRYGGVARISHVALLRGPHVHRSRYLVQVEPELLNDLTDAVCDRGIVLVGQIHSHAPECRTDLSLADRQYGFTVPGYLSMVAPDFASRPRTPVGDCGVHIFEPGAGYRRLSANDVRERVLLVDSAGFDVFHVGEQR